MKDSFVFYRSFYKAIHKIKDKNLKSDIYEAICELALNNKKVEIEEDIGSIIMDLIIPQIEANNERYINGCKGGAPKGNQNAKKKKTTNGCFEKQPNVNDNENDNVCVYIADNDTSSHTPAPTLSELRSYCYENDMEDFDYENFYNYYESNGWLNKNGSAIKNWKAKLKYWYNDDKKNGRLKKIDTRRRLD